MGIKFDKKELEVVGKVNEAFPHAPQVVKYNTPISMRENYLKMVNKNEKPLWIPAHQECLYLGPNIFPDITARIEAGAWSAEAIDKNLPGGKDMFGLEWVYVKQVNGSMPKPGVVMVPDWENWQDYITFPDPKTWDWEQSAKVNAAYTNQGQANCIGIHNGFLERLSDLSNMADACVALVDEDVQPSIHKFFDRLSDLYVEMIDLSAKHFDIDGVWFNDDWGTQLAPIISPDTTREMILPYLKKVTDAAHRNGLFFDFHSCGKNETLVPVMIEAGVDIWRGQSVNDKEMLFDKYGDQIVLGIEATKLPRDCTDLKAIEKDCQAFVDKYAKSGHVEFVSTGVPAGTREFIYEMSRDVLSE